VLTRLPRPLVCLVTDRRVVGGSLTGAVVQAVEGGVNLVQVREKDLGAAELLRLVVELRQALQGRALLVVNGNADVAAMSQTDGLHLPADGLPIQAARARIGGGLVGRSVHAPHEVAEAARLGADYVLLGTLFPSSSHPGGPTGGLDLVRSSRALCPVPLIGIGGITAANARGVIQAGADGVAVITAILAAPDPREAAAVLSSAVRDAWRQREAA
jgi:thiamine-phosphate pyrophosphorylase